ncbi:MAG: hypothetical protein PCFJNLEI_00719 [Verrucomicrobiae bacterium]|nr:hypothetical protein [Verrucomicrobiae bacterium]
MNTADSPVASIITVNTNEKHRLQVCLPTVFASRGDFEVIIADNNSHDGSREFLATDFPQVRVLANPTNLGFAAGNNRGSRLARGRILVFLNPDTRVAPAWLEQLLAPFADPRVGLTTSKLLLMSRPDCINTCGNDVHISGLTLCRGMNRPRSDYSEGGEISAVSGAAFAIRRELFETLGGFDEDYFIYMEETDLALRARLNGWTCHYAPGSEIEHDYKLRFGPNKVLYQERNRYMTLLKLYRWPTLLLLLPVLFLAELVTWGFVILKDRKSFATKWRAYWDVITNWKVILKKRRETQRLRRVRDCELLRTTIFRLDFGQVDAGGIGKLARGIFDPCFWVLRWLILAIVRW